MGLGCQPSAQHPTWRIRVSLFVWNLTLALSGFGDTASSNANAGIALEIMGSPEYYNKSEIPVEGGGGGSFFLGEARGGLYGFFFFLIKKKGVKK